MLIYICFMLYGLQAFLCHLVLLGKSLIVSCFLVEETEAHRGYVLYVAKLFQMIQGEVRIRALISTIFLMPPLEEAVKMSWI